MRSRAWWCVIGLLLLAGSTANSEDFLGVLDGVWVQVNPPGPQIMFHKTTGGLRQVGLPDGLAMVTKSDGKDASNLKISGPGIDCYYQFTQTGPREMVLNLMSGSAKCPRSAEFKKAHEQPTTADQAPAGPPQTSFPTTANQAPASPAPTSPPEPPIFPKLAPAAAPRKVCTHAHGDHVVVGMPWNEGGLELRSAPGNGDVQGVIPPTGVGIGVGDCVDNWCEVEFGCQSGWADSTFLLPRSEALRRVTGVRPSDPEGLNVRTGPHYNYPVFGSIPHNAKVVEHICQESPYEASQWCLITYQNQSGWVSDRYLGFDDGVGSDTAGTETAYAGTPWGSVMAAYREKGYTERAFQNRYGNVWNVWTSVKTRNTLIWSENSNRGKGEGFNCLADSRPNIWGSCTRYDLVSGQAKGKVSIRLDNAGTVIARPL